MERKIGAIPFNPVINTIREAKKVYAHKVKALAFVDSTWSFINLSVILALFSSNSYQETSRTQLTKQNIIRIICLVLSILTCAVIVFRKILYTNIEHIKYLLGLKLRPKQNKKKYIKLVLEYIVHIIQPYPYLTYSTTFKFNDYSCKFSLDLLLWIIASLRLYSLSHLLSLLSNYALLRAERIYSLYKIKVTYWILYKIEILRNKFITILISLFFIILFGTCLLCAIEQTVIFEGKLVKTWYDSFILVIQSCTRRML